ncbi:MAG: hypothetical protein IID41_10745 [Planctomycetes bacterium]|nr:hypothetical protein [Planctomycetota bacterium]
MPGTSSPAPRRKTEASRLRNTARWQRFRASYRKRFPLCCDPFGWHREADRCEAMKQIHHIEPIDHARNCYVILPIAEAYARAATAD